MGQLMKKYNIFRIFNLYLLIISATTFTFYSKFFSVHAMKAYGRNENRVPLIFDLIARWR
jgi:hypothetical protein